MLYSTTRIYKMNYLGNKSDCIIEIIASVIWVIQLEWENRRMKMGEKVPKKMRKKRNIQIWNVEKKKKMRWRSTLTFAIDTPELASRFSRARSLNVHSLEILFFLSCRHRFWLVSFFFWWLKCKRKNGERCQTKELFHNIKMCTRILVMVASH